MSHQNPNTIVRDALEPTLTQFGAWRSDLASFSVRAGSTNCQQIAATKYAPANVRKHSKYPCA